MQDNSDDLVFAEEGEVMRQAPLISPWKVIIVDDEETIHDVTTMALDGVEYEGKPINFISCYSASEAKEAIKDNPDAALVLLDVVMETDTAGLEVVKYIREVINNNRVRIVLRTGQPGQAPERKLIIDYDINDYKEKTELTSTKMFTMLISSLRAYSDINTIERNRLGLSYIINATKDIFRVNSLETFTAIALEQLTAFIHTNPATIYKSDVQINSIAATYQDGEWKKVSGIGKYSELHHSNLESILQKATFQKLKEAQETNQNIFEENLIIAYFKGRLGHKNALIFEGKNHISSLEKELINLFVRNVSISLENTLLISDIDQTQKEIIYMLGEAVESRSKETGKHVKRVAKISKLLALKYGLSNDDAVILEYASPLHDLGKIAIPDAILNKHGMHTEEERVIMQTHAEIGHRMLSLSKRKILKSAAIIALEHHERWDGTGYPHQKSGEDIHIYGRITAIVDVFDALLAKRCYKEPWSLEKVLTLLQQEKGNHFEPKLVDLLLENIEEILEIQRVHADLV